MLMARRREMSSLQWSGHFARIREAVQRRPAEFVGPITIPDDQAGKLVSHIFDEFLKEGAYHDAASEARITEERKPQGNMERRQ